MTIEDSDIYSAVAKNCVDESTTSCHVAVQGNITTAHTTRMDRWRDRWKDRKWKDRLTDEYILM